MIEELLARSGADHVELLQERQELLRFGGSRITYQHSEEKVTLRARRGRACVTLGSLDAELLQAHLKDAPRGELEPAPQIVPRQANTAFAATEAATPADRVELFRSYVAALPAGANLGGSIAHTVVDHAVANAAGVLREERRTRALVQLIASQAGRSSYAVTRSWRYPASSRRRG